MLEKRQIDSTAMSSSDLIQLSEFKSFKQTSIKNKKNNGGERSSPGGLVCSKGLGTQADARSSDAFHQQCLLKQLEQLIRCVEGDTQSLHAQQACGLCETSIAIELGYFSELAFKLKQLYAQERDYFQIKQEV